MTIGNVQFEVSRFWSRSASSFDTRASHVVQAEPWQQVLAAAFQADAPKDVVDLGTGTGACAIIAARLGHRVRGYDGSKGMLEAAKAAAAAAGVEVAFVEGVIEHAPIEPASADIVTLRNVLWTVENPHAVLRRAREMLRPDGLILISDGVWAAAPGFRSTYSEELEMRLPYHAGLGEDEARELLRQADFGPAQSWQHLFAASPYPHDVPMFVLTAHRS